MTFSPQILQPDGDRRVPAAGQRPVRGWLARITNPACGITTFAQAKAAAPAQSPRIISPDYKNPYTWQSSIGFQKQIN